MADSFLEEWESDYKDPAMVHSNFERQENERYFTEHWCTEALIPYIPEYVTDIWEPAAGRGDIVKVLDNKGYAVWASDVDMSEYFEMDSLITDERNFFETSISPYGVNAIITNPPYGKEEGNKVPLSERFVRHALSLDVDFVAMLMRSEFNAAVRRVDLFNQLPFAYEIVLTKRPRWDKWWEKEKPDKGPRHWFSWFCWDKRRTVPSTTYWAVIPSKKRKKNASAPA